MKIQIKSWTPSNANFTRFYVTNLETSEQVGYIQTDSITKGYGDSRYAVHRAAKGDYGMPEVANITVVGDAPILQAVVNLAKEMHPAAKFSQAEADKSIDVQLHRMSANCVMLMASSKRKKAQKSLSFDV